MADKVQKIREEVERLKRWNNNVRNSTRHMTLQEEDFNRGKHSSYLEILNFIDSLQEESVSDEQPSVILYGLTGSVGSPKEEPVSDELEKIIEEIVDPTVLNAYGTKELARRLRNTICGTSVSEDLEEAIDTYLATYFGGEKEKQDWPFLKKMVIYFTNLQKEQMMAKAVDAHCFGFQGAALFSFRLPASTYLVGSEVKVVVIKED